LQLYGRDGCHLCTEFEEELRAAFPELAVTMLDVDADPAWVRRHGHRVPVLCDGAVEICCHYLDSEALRGYLRAARGSPASAEPPP
jgi:hypothetical protein